MILLVIINYIFYFSNQNLLHFRTIEEGRFLKCNSVFTEAAHVLVCDTFERIVVVSIYMYVVEEVCYILVLLVY